MRPKTPPGKTTISGIPPELFASLTPGQRNKLLILAILYALPAYLLQKRADMLAEPRLIPLYATLLGGFLIPIFIPILSYMRITSALP